MIVTKKKNGGRHMRRKVGRKVISTVLSAALITSGLAFQTGDVSAAKKVKKLTLNKKSATLYKGADKAYSSITLKATVKPTKSAKVKFTTSNKKVATVSSKGVVNAKKPGKVTITAKAGSKKTVCKITVKKITKKVKKVTVKKSNVTVYVGKTSKISASVTPKKVTLKKLTYKTSNKKVATVSASGVIKGVKAGKAKITVAAVDGSKKKATVTVTVKKKASNPTPTVEPTIAPAPSTEPTTAPSTEPTAAPSTSPGITAAPSTSPAVTAAPSTSPAVTASPAPTTPSNGGGSSSGGSTTVKTEVKPDIKNGIAKYTLSTNKSYTVKYGDGYSVDVTANDVKTVMSFVNKYASSANKYNTPDKAYEKFVEEINKLENKEIKKAFDAGAMTVKCTGTDTYKVDLTGVKNPSTSSNSKENYSAEVTAKVDGSNVEVKTVDATKTVTGTVDKISSTEVSAKDIKVTKNGKDYTLSSVTVGLDKNGNVVVDIPESNNLKIFA